MKIVVIGGSAGGIEGLRGIAAGLRPDFPSPILVVIHMPADERSLLASILRKSGPLEAVQARDGEALRPGVIYAARPDHHLLVEQGRIKLARGPRENRVRPAI